MGKFSNAAMKRAPLRRGTSFKALLASSASVAVVSAMAAASPAAAQTCTSRVCTGDEVFEANYAGAVNQAQNWGWWDNAVLNASAEDAVLDGNMIFYDNAVLNATAARSINGAVQNMFENSRFNVTATDAVVGGEQRIMHSSVMNVSATHGVNGGWLRLRDVGVVNLLADNALAAATNVDFYYASTWAGGSGGGTLRLLGTDTTIGTLTSVNNGAGTVTNDGTANSMLSVDSAAGVSVYSGVLRNGAGAGKLGLTLLGGDLTLSGGNTYTGGTIVEGGVLRAGSATGLVDYTDYVVNDGVLDLGGFNLVMSSLSGTGGEVAMGAANLTVDQAAATSFAGKLSGTGTFKKAGAGTLTLSGGSSGFAGGILVDSGTLRLEGLLGGLKTVLNSAVLDVAAAGAGNSGNISGANNATINALVTGAFDNTQFTLNNDSVLNVSAERAISGDSNIRLRDNSRVNILSNDALDPTTRLNFYGVNATIDLKGFSTTVSRLESASLGAGIVTNSGASHSRLTYAQRSGPSVFSGVLRNGAGRLGLTVTLGNLTLSGANAYTGGTTVNGGILRAGSAGGFVDNTDYVVNGGKLDLGGFDLVMSSLSGTGGEVAIGTATLTVDQAVDTRFAGRLSGEGAFIKDGIGVLTLSGDSSAFDGTTTLQAGKLVLEGGLGGDVEAYGDSVLDVAVESAFGLFGAQTFYDNSTLNVLAADAVNNGMQTFWGTSVLNVRASDAIVGGMQIFNENSVLNASAARAIVDSTQEFNDDSILNATAAQAIYGGWQDFYGDSTLNASVQDAIVGGAQSFEGTAKLNVAVGGIAGGDQGFWGGGVLNAMGGNAIKAGRQSFREFSTLNALAANAVAGGEQTFRNASTLNVLAHNALASTTDIRFEKVGGTPSSGTLKLNGFSTTIGRISSLNGGAGLITNDGATDSLLTVNSSAGASTFSGIVQNGSGGGKLGLVLTGGDFTLSGTNSYSGGTTINGGRLTAGSAGGFVDDTAYVVNGGRLDLGGFGLIMSSLSGTGGAVALSGADLTVRQAVDTSFAGGLSGPGMFIKSGAGVLTLSGDSSTFAGGTRVAGGVLRVNGVLGGDVAARGFGAVGGGGRIMGDLDLTGGGALLGAAGQTLRIDGGAVMDGTSIVNVAFGAPSNGALFDVGGDLTLDGVLNVTDTGGFGAGVYRLFDYGGALTNNGLVIGARPAGVSATDLGVQTSVAGRVNLVSTGGMELGFWDGGDAFGHDNGVVNGGTGVWRADNRNWTQADGAFNGRFNPNPTYAVFQGLSGIVAVDVSAGAIGVTGMQFAADGYIVNGGSIALQGAGGQSVIRVGDGTAAGAGMGAIITSALTGDSMLIKSDFGTLALHGVNTYTGGTRIDAGMLAVGADANLGHAAGAVVLNGGVLGAYESFDTHRLIALNAAGRFEVAVDKTLGLGGMISGTGDLIKQGAGVLTLTGANTYDGDTMVQAGTLIGNAASIRGDIRNAGTVILDQATNASFAGAVSGAGGFTKSGVGALTLTGDSSAFTGMTTVTAGALILQGRLGSNYAVRNNAVLEAAVADALSASQPGAVRDFYDNSMLKVTAARGVSGGDQKFHGDSVLNAEVAGAISGGKLSFLNNSTLNARTAGSLGDVSIGLHGQAVLNVLANNALTAQTDFVFDSGSTGMLRLNGHSTEVGKIVTMASPGAVIVNDGDRDAVLSVDSSASASSFGGVLKDGAGVGRLGLTLTAGALTLGGSNSYTGGTTVNGGVLKAGAAGVFVANTDHVVNGGRLDLNGFDLMMSSLSGRGGEVAIGAANLTVDQATGGNFAGALIGSGSFMKAGDGSLTLTGDSSAFTGGAVVSGGTLRLNGVLGGDVAARTNGVLTGSGRIMGDIDLTGGGVLAGMSGQTLRIDGDAVMDGTSTINVALGGTSNTALFDVGGDLALNGVLNVSDAGGFGVGVYRLFDYGGALTGSGLAMGARPAGVSATDLAVQTAIVGKVNLISTFGAELSFWDGDDASRHDNGAVDGGAGVWRADGRNWTQVDGGLNGSIKPKPTFAVFQNEGGIVAVDVSAGAIGVTGMQFAADGYVVNGGSIALQGASGQSVIRVGDGTAAGADMGAIITSTLTGDSMLVKSDFGMLALHGVNTYTGGTRIDAGMLAVGADANLGHAAGAVVLNGGVLGAYESFDTHRSIILNAAGRFEVAVDKTLGLGGVISGAGDLIKQGAGVLTLTGANTYDGDTVVQAGTLIGNAASIRGDIRNAGTVILDQATNASFAGAIDGPGGTNGLMVKRGSGDLSLAGVSSLDWTVEAGTLITAANRFGGDAAIRSGGGLTFSQGSDSVYGGRLSGSGAFNIAGTGAVMMTGDSSAFTGTTLVGDGARLIVGVGSGGALGGAMTIGSGGLLGGTGRIGSAGSVLTIAAGGVHAPGNSIGVQTIAGDYVNRGVLRIEATPTKADQIIVAGSVDIAGAALDLVLSPTDASNWDVFNGPFKIIDKQSAGAVIGRFDPITKNLIFLDTVLDYAGGDGNDVTLELVRNDVTFAEVGSTRNQISTGRAVDALGNANPLWRSIALSDDKAVVRAGFDALSGEIHASTKTALIEDRRFVRNAVNDRLRVSAASREDRPAVWGQGFGAWGHNDSDGNAAKLSRATTGFLFGADAGVSDHWRIGAAASYERLDVKVKDRTSSGDSDTYQVALYGGGAWDRLALRAGLAYAWHDVATNRSIVIPGVRETLSADLDAETAQGFVEVGYAVQTRHMTFEPFAGLAHLSLHSDSFAETGGKAALSGHGATIDATFSTLGLRAATTVAVNGADLTATGALGWRHAFGETPKAQMRFGDGGAFTIRGAPIARDAALVEAGLDYAISPSADFKLSYSGRLGDGLSDQSFKAGLTLRF